MALDGAHSVDRLNRRKGKSWWPQEHLSDDDLAAAIGPGHVDVILTHDAPDNVDIPGLTPGAFPASEIATGDWHRARVGRVVDATTPEVLFHGHYHVRYTADRGSTAIVGLACDSSPMVEHVVVLDLLGAANRA